MGNSLDEILKLDDIYDIFETIKDNNIDIDTLVNSTEFQEKIYQAIEKGSMSYHFMDELIELIGADNCIEKLDAERIVDSAKDNSRIFYTRIFQNSPEKAIDLVLSSDKQLEEFMNNLDKNYSILNDCNSDKIMKIIEKSSSRKEDYKNIKYVLTNLDDEHKKEILNGDYKDEYIKYIVRGSSKELAQDFILNNPKAFRLYKELGVIRLLDMGVEFPPDIIKKKEFFEALKGSDMIDFRRNINIFNRKNYHPALAARINNYEKSILDGFNIQKGVLKEYDLDNFEEIIKNMDENTDDYLYDVSVRKVLNMYRNMNKKYDENIELANKMLKEKLSLNMTYEELLNTNIEDITDDENIKKELQKILDGMDKDKNGFNDLKKDIENTLKDISSNKFGEILADYEFEDTLNNVQVNAKEMRRFDSHFEGEEKILSRDREELYDKMINMNNLSAQEKYELYKLLPDKEMVRSNMYQDFKDMRDKSYGMMKKLLYKTSNDIEGLDENISREEMCEVYKLSGKEFYMFVRAMNSPYHENTMNAHSCYSLISGENTKTFDEDTAMFLYGYGDIDINKIENVYESDSFTLGVSENITNAPNRLMIPEELVTSSDDFSEINVKNEEYVDKYGKKSYKEMKPTYLVTKAEPTREEIQEAKRLGIPIVWIEIEKYKEVRRKGIESQEYDRDIN